MSKYLRELVHSSYKLVAREMLQSDKFKYENTPIKNDLDEALQERGSFGGLSES